MNRFSVWNVREVLEFALAFFFVIALQSAPLLAKPAIAPSERAVEHNNRGAMLIEQKDLTAAEFELKTAVSLSPDYAEAYNNLGIVYKTRHQLDTALAEFQKAISINKDYTAPYSHIGAIYIEQGRYDAAIEELNKAIHREPTFAYAIYNRGLAILLKARDASDAKAKEKLYASAEQDFVLATQLNPKLVEAHLNLGDLYRETGQLEKATIRYRLALEDNPNDAKIYRQLADVLRAQGKGAEATKLVTQGSQVERDTNSKAKFDEGFQATKEGEQLLVDGKKDAAKVAFTRAAAAFQAALKIDPKIPEATYGLGVAQERLGQHAQARKAWERTLTLQPKHAGALFNLGALSLREGKTSEGLYNYCVFLQSGGNAFPAQRAIVEQALRDNKFTCPSS